MTLWSFTCRPDCSVTHLYISHKCFGALNYCHTMPSQCETEDDILNYVRVISKSRSPSLRKALIHNASSRVVKTICNCCSNCLYNQDLQLPSEKKQRLRSFKAVIKKLADKKISIAQKKHLLQNQTGGFLRTLIPTVTCALGTKANNVVCRR